VHWYERALRLNPKEDGYNFYYSLNLGNQFLDKKNLDSAEHYYRKASAYNLQMEMIYLNLGLVAMYRGGYDEAVALFDKSIALAPTFDNPRRARALALQYKQQGLAVPPQ
jgi:tetratricopeptide (TPR) repeat protein